MISPEETQIGTKLPRADLDPVALKSLRSAGYEILGELGRGGMGVVYLARNLALNRPCALKMILASLHGGSTAVARFRAEAEAVARLRHPGIVQIYHVGEAGGLPFLELEYVSGGSLDRILDGTPRPPADAARLVEDLARAIAEAHGKGIVHRDLKPANVLLDLHGSPKVADFGLAKVLDSDNELTRTQTVLGSPSYMAPEQAEGRSNLVGATSDIYALGAILYKLLVGFPPFRGATALETLAHVKSSEPVPPSRIQPGLPRDIETICLKCLEKVPGRRYATAEALAEDLRRYRAGESILAHPAPAWERAWKWVRRRPALAAALAVVVVAVGILLGGVLYYNARLQSHVAADPGGRASGRRPGQAGDRCLQPLGFRRPGKAGGFRRDSVDPTGPAHNGDPGTRQDRGERRRLSPRPLPGGGPPEAGRDPPPGRPGGRCAAPVRQGPSSGGGPGRLGSRQPRRRRMPARRLPRARRADFEG